MTDIVSIREFARRIGVSLPAVQKAIKNGRIVGLTNDKGRLTGIDWDSQKDAWTANSDPSRRRVTLAYSPEGTEATPYPSGEGTSRGGRPRKDGTATKGAEAPPPSGGMSLAEIKKAREAVNLQRDKLKLDAEKKVLVPADAVKKDMAYIASIVKAGLLSIPDRVSAELAGVTDPHLIHSILMNEINSAMEELRNKALKLE